MQDHPRLGRSLQQSEGTHQQRRCYEAVTLLQGKGVGDICIRSSQIKGLPPFLSPFPAPIPLEDIQLAPPSSSCSATARSCDFRAHSVYDRRQLNVQ